MTASAPSQPVTCPFCAVVCDDLSRPADSAPGTLPTRACARAAGSFTAALAHTTARPRIADREVSWDQALEAARQLLSAAQLPLFHGLQGDLHDCRGALRLAAHHGGVLDHADGEAIAQRLAIFQDSGWISTSAGETRNRADLVLLIGNSAEIERQLPRLQERVLAPAERLHGTTPPDTVTLDSAQALTLLDELRCLVHGSHYAASAAAQALYARLRQARYPVLLPLPGQHPDAGLIVRAAAELVQLLNRDARAALLMLSTGLGAATAQQVSTWHSGYGLRTSFAAGYPQQDLHRFAANRLLQGAEADLLVWISTLDATPPPPCQQPRIVIGHPGIRHIAAATDVFLPAAVPGVHRAGFLHRGDGLQMLPLHRLLANDLPDTEWLVAQLLDHPQDEASSC